MMRNDYDATAKDQSNYYVHWPVAVGRLILLQCDGGEMTMMRNDYDARCLIQMTMMRDVSFKCDGEASSGERGAKWQ